MMGRAVREMHELPTSRSDSATDGDRSQQLKDNDRHSVKVLIFGIGKSPILFLPLFYQMLNVSFKLGRRCKVI